MHIKWQGNHLRGNERLGSQVVHRQQIKLEQKTVELMAATGNKGVARGHKEQKYCHLTAEDP